MIMQETLHNGIRVYMEPMDGIRSVAIGIWVNAGTVRENEGEAGASHFIEHMLFKGTEKRTAEDIAFEMDSIGGLLNAFTSKECTCFYARVLDEQLEKAVDILSDIVLHSNFPPDEMEKERHVVIEEILMSEDTPDDVSCEEATKLFFDGDNLAHPILGSQESILGISRKELMAYKDRHYVPSNIVVACAGSFKPDELVRLLGRYFDIPESTEKAEPFIQNFSGGRRISFVEKDTEQVHITMMLPGYARDTDDNYALSVLSNVIGGSMSSRLFQNIREKQGLAYSVYSYPSSYSSSGAFMLYAGTGEQQAEKVAELMLKELRNIRENGITEEELERGKEQLRGTYVLGMESCNAKMNAIGKVALLQNREYSEEETIRKISRVTMDDINRIIPVVLNEENLCVAFVGRVNKQKDKLNRIVG